MSEQPPSEGDNKAPEGNNQPSGGYGPPAGPYGGYPPYWYGPPKPPDHPDAITVLVLGVLSVMVCPIIGPFAWSKGNQALEDIQASGRTIGGYNYVQAGRICGMVGTGMIVFYLAIVAFYLLIAIGMLSAFSLSA